MNELEHIWRSMQARHKEVRKRWHCGVNVKSGVVLILLVAVVWYTYASVLRAPDDFPSEHIVTISEGATLPEIAAVLERDNIIQSRFWFRVIVRMMGSDRDIPAGDYYFRDASHLITVAERLGSGAYGLEPVRIQVPEGLTATEMAPLFAEHLPRFDEEAFMSRAAVLEGYLFPDTYFFFPNATEDTVIDAMVNNFDRQIADITGEIEASERSLGDIVVMASLLEKEASVYEDRRAIAGVLWSRLDDGMKLQVDAAFLYFLGRTTFDLTLEDLAHESPYNTYRYEGLPPGAITNPSIESIRAAADPVEHDYLFYLADHSGTTHYSTTYEEHLRKKRLYLD